MERMSIFIGVTHLPLTTVTKGLKTILRGQLPGWEWESLLCGWTRTASCLPWREGLLTTLRIREKKTVCVF